MNEDKARRPSLSIFTKPWKELSLESLGSRIAEAGIDGVELPVRPGFQVVPDRIHEDLVVASDKLAECGVKIFSIAADLDESSVRACGAAGVPLIRAMLRIDLKRGYQSCVESFRDRCRELAPLLEEHGVSIGLQNHCDSFVSSSIGIIHAIEPLSSERVSAVLDLGHTGLEGEREDIAIDVAWPRLSMINLKNAIRFRVGKEPDGATRWGRAWVSGMDGFTSWRKSLEVLGRRRFSGPICLTAEYKDDSGNVLAGEAVWAPLKRDLEYVRGLVGEFYF